MRRLAIAITITALLLSGAVSPVGATVVPDDAADQPIDTGPAPAPATNTVQNGSQSPEIVALYPDPVAQEDAGEYVVLEVPSPTNTTGWTLVDDAGAVASLPNRTVSGRTAVAIDPGAVDDEGAEFGSVLPVEGTLQLANGGDGLTLRRSSGAVVSQVSYDRAQEAQRYVRTPRGWEWRVPGATTFGPIETAPDRATAFVLPDAPGVIESEMRDAERRIYLAGYTLTSERVVSALIDGANDDVEVRVLLEGSPVGGTSERQAAALDRLTANGIPVTVLDGADDPFGVHHSKYAVIDDRALVLTENFKPAGTGGHSSRGWGAVVEGADTADAFARVFRADRTGPGAIDWTRHRASVDPVPGGASTTAYPTHFEPASVPIDRARILVAPDNARPAVERLLRTANESIRIQQMEIDGRDDPLLQASIDAARNGTDVEILLSGASYVQSENRAIVRYVEELAAREGLPISASLVEPRGRFSKVHAKVAIVDDRHVVLGSLNWNEAAYEENREVVVVLTGEEVAGYYGDVFAADARSEPLWPIPTGLIGAVVGLWIVLATVAVARIRWAA